MVRVREVKACNVHSRFDESSQLVDCSTCWSNGANDLSLPGVLLLIREDLLEVSAQSNLLEADVLGQLVEVVHGLGEFLTDALKFYSWLVGTLGC